MFLIAVAYPSSNKAWNVHTRMNSGKRLAVFKAYSIVGLEWTRCHRVRMNELFFVMSSMKSLLRCTKPFSVFMHFAHLQGSLNGL